MNRNGRVNANRIRDVRLVKLVQLLQSGRPRSRQELEEELEVARATLTRDIEILRDQLNMPIAYDREANGYILANSTDVRHGPRYEIPGLWITGSQAAAMLTLVNLCMSIDPGVLRPLLPLRSLFKQIMGLPPIVMPPVDDKLAFELKGFRVERTQTFEALARALYQELQIELRADLPNVLPAGRYSPQRFVLTENGWMLDALSHEANLVVRLPLTKVTSFISTNQKAAIVDDIDRCFDGELDASYKTISFQTM